MTMKIEQNVKNQILHQCRNIILILDKGILESNHIGVINSRLTLSGTLESPHSVLFCSLGPHRCPGSKKVKRGDKNIKYCPSRFLTITKTVELH